MITKASIKDELRKVEEAVRSIKQHMLANDGSRVADALESANCAWAAVERLLAEKYPAYIELEDEPEDDDDLEEVDEEDAEEDADEEESEEDDSAY